MTQTATLLFVVICVYFVKCQQEEGDLCIIYNSGEHGLCKLISGCPSAIQRLQTQGRPPQTCGFKGTLPIVCCTGETDETLYTPRPAIITTKAITPAYVTTKISKPIPTTTTTAKPTPPPVLRVGDKSRAKCKEYEKYIYIYPTLGGERTVDCVIDSIQQIVGGTEAKLKEFPHMAAIGYDAGNEIKWQCGGTLISERFVLTAAHCLYHPQYKEPKFIRIGDLDLTSDDDEAEPQQLKIQELFKHPKYLPPSRYHDIGLIKFDRNARLNNYARPACLETNHSLNMTIKPTTTGWGTVAWLSHTSSTLLKVGLEYFTHDECYRAYKGDIGLKLRNGIEDTSQVCAGSHTESKDACQGDSGGPLQIINVERVCMYNIVGLTSFGKGCGVINIPGVYTRVSNYIEWIEEIVWP